MGAASRGGHLKVLRRRLEYLRSTLDAARTRADSTLPYIISEIRALQWAIDELETCALPSGGESKERGR